ncbi:MAG TPA: hypothetical protein VJG32_14560 [Anaerolineae bacterium]|nr:hypothetical protein [Anaerolineae bacterium]
MTLVARLSALESSGLIHLAQTLPDVEYLFRHALVQDAAYSSLVKNDRRRLHLAVGEALERMHPSRLDELAPRLAEHFQVAGDDHRALKYFAQAGDAAARIYALPEAIAHYTRALELAQRPARFQTESVQSLYLKRGAALHSNARWQEAWDSYIELENLGRARGDRSIELAGLVERALLCAIYGPLMNPAQAETLSQQALALARELGDREAEARILWVLMRASTFTPGDPARAVAYGEQSLALARELGLSELLTYTLNDIQYAYRAAGQVDRALTALADARERWQANGNLHMLADNLNQSALITFYLGAFESTLALTYKADEISRASHNLTQQVLSRFIAGQIYFEYGDLGRAIQLLEEGLAFKSPVGLGIGIVLALVYAELGELDRALQIGQSTLAELKDTSLMPVYGPITLSSLARLSLLKGDLATAETFLQAAGDLLLSHLNLAQFLGADSAPLANADLALVRQDYARALTLLDAFLDQLRRIEALKQAPEALYLKGQAYLAQDRLEEARQCLLAARAEAERMNVRRMRWRILAALSRIEAERDNAAEARRLRQQARKVIDYMAEHAGSPELRASFLNSPDVQRVISEQ